MATGVDVIVATLQLDEVSLLVQAMRNADAQAQPPPEESSADQSAGGCGCVSPRVDRYEPGPVLSPEPRQAPAPVIYSRPRIEPVLIRADRDRPIETVVVRPPSVEQPFQPPWKTVPWRNPPVPPAVIKRPPTRPDNNQKGMLIDSFI